MTSRRMAVIASVFIFGTATCAIGLAPDVLSARHGNRSGEPDEGPDDRMAEERGLGERDERSGKGGQQQHRVDERVLVIGGQDDRPARGHALRSDHVHAPIEQGEEPARQGADEPGPRLMRQDHVVDVAA